MGFVMELAVHLFSVELRSLILQTPCLHSDLMPQVLGSVAVGHET